MYFKNSGFFEGQFEKGILDQNKQGTLFIYKDKGMIDSYPAFFVLFQTHQVARITTMDSTFTLNLLDGELYLKDTYNFNRNSVSHK
jgi:hypothetical protein